MQTERASYDGEKAGTMPHYGLAYLVLIGAVVAIGLPLTVVAEKVTGKKGHDADGLNAGIYGAVAVVLVVWLMLATSR